MHTDPLTDTRQDDDDWVQIGEPAAVALIRAALAILERRQKPSGEGLFYAAVNDR